MFKDKKAGSSAMQMGTIIKNVTVRAVVFPSQGPTSMFFYRKIHPMPINHCGFPYSMDCERIQVNTKGVLEGSLQVIEQIES